MREAYAQRIEPCQCTLHRYTMQNAGMATPDSKTAKRLIAARGAAGYEKPTDAARAMGVVTATYLGHENGSRGLARSAARYAKFFKVSLDWLLTGRGQMGMNSETVPVILNIGAGAELYPVDDHPQGRGLEMVEPPPGVREDCVAARIRGNSMHPLKDGWLVFWTRQHEGVPDTCIGQLCICQIKDGPTLLKDLYLGSAPGVYTLSSWNAPPRTDVVLEWASPVIDIRPR